MERPAGAAAPLPWRDRAPLLLGHRGAPRLAHENTLASFRAALLAGLDGLETDLQRTSDGALVISHDPYLHGDDGAPDAFIAKLALAEVRRREPAMLDLGDLRAFMEDFPAALVNLELKTAAPFDDPRAAELTRELGGWPEAVRRRLWLSSFDPLQLLTLAATRPDVPLAFLAFDATALALLPSLPVVAVHPHHSLVTAERMSAWRAAGLAVFVWTVNDVELARRLLGLGVDGLIGDVPEALLAARR